MEDIYKQLAALSLGNSKVKLYGGIAALVVLVLVIVLIVFKWKQAKNLVVDAQHNRELARDLDEEISPEKVTITQEQFNSFASKLYHAMKGLGTREQDIFDVFEQMQSRSDVLQLIKTFGIKDGDNLKAWLYDDLNSSEINKINQILATNGVNYIF